MSIRYRVWLKLARACAENGAGTCPKTFVLKMDVPHADRNIQPNAWEWPLYCFNSKSMQQIITTNWQ